METFFAHETAVIDEGVEIGEGTSTRHFSYIMTRCRIGAGCMGDIGTTSFFPSKNLGACGDGGARFVYALAERATAIANHGQRVKYRYDLIGCNSRLDTRQATSLDVNLRHLDRYTRARQAATYDEALTTLDGATTPRRVTYSSHVFHQYTLRVHDGQRDAWQAHLKRDGIPSTIYYPIPLHLQSTYRQTGILPGTLPVAERLCEEVLPLPIHTKLHVGQIERIVAGLHSCTR
jgi:dTDP-4-amino-4,6-dideoxygalactose transaminase